MLHQAGLVSRTKDGTTARYAIADESVFELCEHVCGGLRRQLAELDAVLADDDRVSGRGAVGRLGHWTATHFRAVVAILDPRRGRLGIFAPRAEHALSGAGWEATGSESVTPAS